MLRFSALVNEYNLSTKFLSIMIPILETSKNTIIYIMKLVLIIRLSTALSNEIINSLLNFIGARFPANILRSKIKKYQYPC